MIIHTSHLTRLSLIATAMATATISSLSQAATLTWDHDADGTASDGDGVWLDANKWLDGVTPATWNNATPDSAIIGSGGVANNFTIDLTGGVTVQDATFDNFQGRYRLSNDLLTIAPNGTLTWGPNTTANGSNEGVEFQSSASLAGDTTSTVVVDGNYPADKSRGQFNIRTSDVSAFNGTWDVRNGVLFTEGNFRPSNTSNIKMNGGPGASQGAVYSSRWGQTLDRALGTGANQIQVLGNRSGFEGQGTNGLTVRLDGTGNQAVQWGSADFNPSVLLLMSPNANNNSTTNFDTAVDLNGADRTVEVDKEHGRNIFDTGSENNWGRGQGVLNLAITNSSGTAAGLVKEGVGRLQLNGTNTYDGGTTVNAGQIYYTKAAAMPGTGTHTFNTGSELQVAIGGGDDFTIGAGTAPGSLGGLLSGTGPGTSTTAFNGDITVTLIGSGTVESDLPDVGGGGTNYWMVNGNTTISGNNTFTGTMRVGKRGGSARTVTLGSSTALQGADVIVDTGGISELDLNGFDATIGNLELGSNSGWGSGLVKDDAGGGTLTLTGGVNVLNHNGGSGQITVDTLDLNGAEQIFSVQDGGGVSLPITGVVQNGSLTMAGQSSNAKMRLEGVNTYTGETKVTGGILETTSTTCLADATEVRLEGSGKINLDYAGTDTIAELYLGGVAQGAGVYDNSTDPTWITGTGSLTVGAAGSPFDTWAGTGTLGPVTFAGDTNGDGVQDGMAFLLGVANPDDDANGNLPAVSEDGSGNLVMTFECLAIADRGTATLNVQHSGDLSAWAPLPNGVLVPDASGGPTDGVTFVVGDGSDGPGGLNGVTATIDSSLASGGKLFGRLNGTE